MFGWRESFIMTEDAKEDLRNLIGSVKLFSYLKKSS